MTAELRGTLQGQGLRIGIVVSRFNELVTTRLLDGARAALTHHGVQDADVTVATVPGSFEIPLIAKKMAESRRYDAVVCLGAVVRGETDHYHHIATEAAKGVANAGLAAGVPVLFGVLTTDTVEQAIERSGGKDGVHSEVPRASQKAALGAESADANRGNSGYNAGVAAIEMANLLRALDSG